MNHEGITVKEVYKMFNEVKDEIHKASKTCLQTQNKCHEEFNELKTTLQIHIDNSRIHLEELTSKKKINCKYKTFWYWLKLFLLSGVE